jgi:hypothetical protein
LPRKFPFDLAERVVLDDDDLDVEIVFHAGGELAHQHGEAAIADDGDDRALGIGDRRGDRVGQAARHRREIAGA